jgi:two-component system CheB/CheR fusion protein
VLGKAETTSPLPEFFSPVNSLLHIYRRYGEPLLLPKGPTNGPSLAQTSRLTPELSADTNRVTRFTPQANRPRTSTERLGDAVLELPVGIAIVDRHYDVQSINSAALRLLGIHRSAVGEDLLHLADDVPQKPLRHVIDAAFRNLNEQETEATLVIDADERRAIHIRGYAQLPQRDGSMIESVVLLISPATAQPGASASGDEDHHSEPLATAA